MIRKDLDLMVYKLPRDISGINIYPLGDLHYGSEQFNEDRWNRWKSTVMADPFGYVVLVGDLIDNGLKNSKTNSYEATVRPRDQKRWLANELTPFAKAGKLLGGIGGNHEGRSTEMSDDSPLYDILAKLDLEDIYRENMAFIKVSLGEKNKDRQYTYVIALAHGSGKRKTEVFSLVLDNVDLFVTGHIHDASSKFPAKLIVDTQNDIIREQDYIHLTVPSFLSAGGYGLRGLYEPRGFKIPVVHLSGKEKYTSLSWI